MDVRELSEGLRDELVALRRELHQIPERGLDLPQTQARILAELEGLPLEISTGQALTSVTAVLRGGRAPQDVAERPVVLLRGDMDALPVTEDTGLEYASTNGFMHACGHDLHMAGLVGAVKVLCQLKDELAGDVVFMFQPGEEGDDGAGHMIAEGVLEAAGKKADRAFAIHVFSAIDEGGTVACRPGTIMAAVSEWKAKVVGQGGHGSTPQLAKDPIPAICEMVTATHAMVTRRFDIFDPVVVTVGHVAGGSAPNVIPGTAELEATLRTFSEASRDKLFRELETLSEGIAAAHNCIVENAIREQYPATVNHEGPVELVRRTAVDLFGEDKYVEWTHSLAAAEDFSRVLLEVPGAFIGLSAVPQDADPRTAEFNHSPKAVFDDGVLPQAAALLAELTLRSFEELGS